MVCDLCKDGEAVIQLTEIEGSGVRQLHLCEKCAAERGVETTLTAAKPQINNFLQTLHEQMPAAKGEPAHCSFCQATLADFRATGRLGCAHCYETSRAPPESTLQFPAHRASLRGAASNRASARVKRDRASGPAQESDRFGAVRTCC